MSTQTSDTEAGLTSAQGLTLVHVRAQLERLQNTFVSEFG